MASALFLLLLFCFFVVFFCGGGGGVFFFFFFFFFFFLSLCVYALFIYLFILLYLSTLKPFHPSIVSVLF